MDELTIVEVQDAKGVMVSRQNVPGERITVGRSSSNSVVVTDEYVEGEHFVAERAPDGSGYIVRDLGSRNGTRVSGRVVGEAGDAVAFGEPLEIGQSTVVLRRVHSDVPEAKELPSGSERLFAYARIPTWRLGAILLLFGTGSTWWSSHDKLGWAETIGVAVGFAILFSAWAGLWAGGTRIFTGRARFREHLGWSCTIGLVLLPLSTLLTWVDFAIGHPAADFFFTWVLLGFASWGVSLFGHIDIASRKSRGVKVGIAGVVTLLLMSAGWGFQQIDVAPSAQIQRTLGAVSPVPPSLTRSTSWENFSSELTDVADELDAARQEMLDESEEDESE